MNVSAQESTESLILRGHSLEDAGDAAAALALYEQAARIDPRSVSALLNRGNALLLLGRREEAMMTYQKATTLGDSPGAWLNIGNLCIDDDDLQAAAAAYANALKLRPHWPDASFGLICVAHRRGDPDLIQQLQQFLNDQPGHPAASLMLAEALCEIDPDSTISLLRALPIQDARNAALLARAAIMHFDNDLALASMDRALTMDPGNANYLTFRTFRRMIVPAVDPVEPVNVIRKHLTPHPELPLPLREQGPFRIGYLTQDFRAHPAANFLIPLLRGHQRENFRVVAISNLDHPDALTPRLLGAADEVVEIAHLDDTAAFELLRKANLDVVVDFSGWSVGNRLPLLARRIAPIQITAIGVYLTTGIPAVDFRICDAASDPPGLTEHQHSERLLRTTGPHCCYHELRPISASPSQPARQNGHFTFGFFNNSAKVTRSMIDQWIEILRRVPNARMKILGVRHEASRRWLGDRLRRAGVGSRVSILGRIDTADYDGTLTTVDLALDSHPYNGGTTTIECLLAGVPVLTHSGPWPFSRSARVFLNPLNLSDWAVDSAEAFVERAIQIATGPLEPLESLRAELPQRVRNSALMDQARYIERWEATLLSAIEIRRAELSSRKQLR